MKILVTMVVCVTLICLFSFSAGRPRGVEGYKTEQWDDLTARRKGSEQGNKLKKDEKARYFGGIYPWHPYYGYVYGPYVGYF